MVHQEFDTQHWPDKDSADYAAVSDCAISLLISAGHDPNDIDSFGDTVDDWLQAGLMDCMFRSPNLFSMLDGFDQLVGEMVQNRRRVHNNTETLERLRAMQPALEATDKILSDPPKEGIFPATWQFPADGTNEITKSEMSRPALTPDPPTPLSPDFKVVELDAFNLVPGATFVQYQMMTQPGEPRFKVWVVMQFADLHDQKEEHVGIICRRADDADSTPFEMTHMTLHYGDKVDFIGIVRNPADFDDNNWGS